MSLMTTSEDLKPRNDLTKEEVEKYLRDQYGDKVLTGEGDDLYEMIRQAYLEQGCTIVGPTDLDESTPFVCMVDDPNRKGIKVVVAVCDEDEVNERGLPFDFAQCYLMFKACGVPVDDPCVFDAVVISEPVVVNETDEEKLAVGGFAVHSSNWVSPAAAVLMMLGSLKIGGE